MELSAPRSCPASGVVVEAQVDKGLGPVATVIVHKGELKVGDPVVVGTKSGKVRRGNEGEEGEGWRGSWGARSG